jgi:hypothetical protein
MFSIVVEFLLKIRDGPICFDDGWLGIANIVSSF